jgi:hypothetical protein
MIKDLFKCKNSFKDRSGFLWAFQRDSVAMYADSEITNKIFGWLYKNRKFIFV